MGKLPPMKRRITITLLAFALIPNTRAQDAGTLHRAIKTVTDVMVHDIFSPPVASRIYAYISVAAYEAARPGDPRGATSKVSGQLAPSGDHPATGG